MQAGARSSPVPPTPEPTARLSERRLPAEDLLVRVAASLASAGGRPAGASANRQQVSPPLAAQQPSRDHQPLHLAGAFIDGGDADVAVEARDLVLVGEAVAAVDLEALPAGPVGGLAGVQLGLRGEARRVLAAAVRQR